MTRVAAALMLMLFAATAFANDSTKELDSAAVVIRNMTSSHQIPSSVLQNTECLAIIPAVKQAAVIVGGKHGNGVASCRTATGWSAPAFISITGGSVGLQAGLEHQDLVLLLNNQGEQELERGQWSLGAEAAVAGPMATSSGGTEANGWKTPVLVYTTSTGAYAGASLEGSKISVDDQNMRNLYGPNASLQLVLNGQIPSPASAQAFLSTLNQVAKK
ncbi:MAG TPA: lipid-binding SYLF domain-containing protein [Terriglobales bacterium]|nr:lipid-binding SYLF domain-containing protein [Terriglobales bacterium]